jgi:hypothetical protein
MKWAAAAAAGALLTLLPMILGVVEGELAPPQRNASSSCSTTGSALLQVGTRMGVAQSEQLAALDQRPLPRRALAAAPRSELVSSLRSWGGPSHVPSSVLQKSSQAVHALAARSRMYTAHQAYLRRSMQAAELHWNASNKELDKLVEKFIQQHTASEDKCPALLLEAKHQLNTLHQLILNELAGRVNTSEGDILKDSGKVKKNQDELEELNKWKRKRDEELADKKAEICKMLETLRKEIAELRAIAQPQVTLDIRPDGNSSLNTNGGPLSLASLHSSLSLLQDGSSLVSPSGSAPNAIPQAEQVAKTQDLVQKTHDAAKEVLYCEERSGLWLSQQSTQQTAFGMLQQAQSWSSTSPGDCSSNLTVSVTVGNGSTTKTLKAPGEITHGYYRAVNCTDVNSSYAGSIWLHCNDSTLSADSKGCIPISNNQSCMLQKSILEKAYVKAYVELARLIDEYDQMCSSNAEETALEDEYNNKKDPLQTENENLNNAIDKSTESLQGLKPKLQDALNAEARLRDHIQVLSNECSQLNATESSLDQVRLAIQALEACPGLVRPEFHIPEWVGNWTTFQLDNQKTDLQNDDAMLAACQAAFGEETRPAEVGEIEAHSIEGAPVMNNTADVPLLGACPRCEGRADNDTGLVNAQGHARACWFPGTPLTAASRQDCSKNLKAIMCVTDRGNIRKMVWHSNQTISSKDYNYTGKHYNYTPEAGVDVR